MFNGINDRLKKNGYTPDHIFDIGAYKGHWTDSMLQIYPDSKYYLFEPIDYPELNRFRNSNKFTVNNEILFEKVDTVDWYEGKNTGDSIFKEVSYHYDNIAPIKRQTNVLDNFYDENMQNLLVKIDCQGAEISILKGASKLYDKIDFIILELPFFGKYNHNVPDFKEHINFMSDIGFVVYDFLESHYVNNFNMQVDILFINKNHIFNSIVQDKLRPIESKNYNGIKTVAFLSNKLTLRGTEIAIYDYADYNEKLLGNKSIIITRDYEDVKYEYDTDILAYNKFKNRFPVSYYRNKNDIDKIVKENNITHLFVIKSGENDGLMSNYCKNIIQCVFTTKHPHGDVYVAIGQTLNQLNGTSVPIFPHIVTLPESSENLRSELNIPSDAIVFGRYGGKESFDIRFVYSVIKSVLHDNRNIYFLFMNTNKFCEDPNIIFIEGNADMLYKRKFINSCDALLHARVRGETFGLTCGEFSICNKPVITWGGSVEREHLNILGDKAVVYNSPAELKEILSTFYRGKYDVSENGYMNYNPENVMKIFDKVCLI